MRTFLNIGLFLCLLGLSHPALAQNWLSVERAFPLEFPINKEFTTEQLDTINARSSILFQESSASISRDLQSPVKIHLSHQAFFCRIESILEERSSIAPRFRLGSVEYVNKLEGKDRL